MRKRKRLYSKLLFILYLLFCLAGCLPSVEVNIAFSAQKSEPVSSPLYARTGNQDFTWAAAATLLRGFSPYYTDGILNPYIYKEWDGYKSYVGQCTWYVYGRIQEMNLISQEQLMSPSGGPYIFRSHARNWVADVTSAPSMLTIEDTPQRGDIAVWHEGRNNHVAVVEEVAGGRVLVTESNIIPPDNTKHVVVGSPKGVRLRKSPEVTDDNIIDVLPRFSILDVVGGPRKGDGYTWYQLKDSRGTTGWAAWIGSGVIYNYTGIVLEPSTPALGEPHSYIRIHGGAPTPLQPASVLDGISISGWNVAQQRVVAGDTIELRLDLANDSAAERTFFAGVILQHSDGESIFLEKTLTLQPKQCRSEYWRHTIALPGDWDIQFGIWKQRPLTDANLITLYPASPMEGYITVVLERPPAPSIIYPGSSLEPGNSVLDTLTPFLEWNKVNGADYYEVWISREPYGEHNIVHNSGPVESTGYRVPDGVLRDGENYRWNMAASNSAGRSNFSNRLYFRVDLGRYPAEPFHAGEDPWEHWRAMVDKTIQVNYYSPEAGRVVRPWVYKVLWTLPRSGADYYDVLALRNEQHVYVYWTEDDWRMLCEAVGPRELLARLIHSEAACQGETGWITIANNVLNRVDSLAYPNTICAIIFQIRTLSVPQYCGVLTERFLKFDNEHVRRGIYEVVDRALEGILEDITGGATAYYNPDLANSKWHESRGEAVRIGDHVFMAGEQPVAIPISEELQIEYNAAAPFYLLDGDDVLDTDNYIHVGRRMATLGLGSTKREVIYHLGEPESIYYYQGGPIFGDYIELEYPFIKISLFQPLEVKDGDYDEYCIFGISTNSHGVYGPRNINVGESYESVIQKYCSAPRFLDSKNTRLLN